jgi:hypothetical protein
MRLYNGELATFTTFLLSIPLSGRDSRMRSRFLRLVQDRLTEIEQARLELLTKYSNKSPEGEPLTRTEPDGTTVYDISNESRPLFDQEFYELRTEVFQIDELPERMDMLCSVRDAILNVEGMTFSGQDALLYDRWCEIVEEIGNNN